MKVKRNLSGMYFRFKYPESQKYDSICFEDLPKEEQKRILNAANPEYANSIALRLADVLNNLGEQFDIVAGELSE